MGKKVLWMDVKFLENKFWFLIGFFSGQGAICMV